MKARTLLVLFALLGLGSSLTSTYVHYNLLQNPSYSSFCDVSATVSCTQAYLSRYGSLFGSKAFSSRPISRKASAHSTGTYLSLAAYQRSGWVRRPCSSSA